MKILFLSHYFPPEIGPGQTRVFEYGRGLVRKGHQVTVLTTFPNYPTGIVPVKYRGRFFMREKMEGLEVVRTYVYATPNEGFFKRILNHLSFAVSSVIGAIFLKNSYDIVNVISPPLFLGFSGYIIALIRKAKLVFEVRDPWPDVAVILGMLKNSLFIRISTSLEKFIYKKSVLITAASWGFFRILLKKGVPYHKLSILPAGVDVDFFRPGSDNSHFRNQHKLNDKFIVMYAGNHGLSHNLETLLSVADFLREKEDIKFVLVGDGVEKNRLIRLARKNGLSNVLFLPPVPRKRIKDLLNSSDVCVASLRKELIKKIQQLRQYYTDFKYLDIRIKSN
ncbi:MAG: glycosyltransferase family 4 protein [Candidatus Hodarchaeota archaeon]